MTSLLVNKDVTGIIVDKLLLIFEISFLEQIPRSKNTGSKVFWVFFNVRLLTLGWPRSLFRVFHMMLQETLKEIFDQYILSICGFYHLALHQYMEDTASSVPQQYRIFSFHHLSSLICEMVLYVLNLVAFKLSVKLNKLKGLFAICRSLINCLCP